MAVLVGTCAVFDIMPQHPQDFRWQDLVCQFLLLHGLPGAPTVAWNSPTWTLSALFFCYAATPMFLRATRKPALGLMWACLSLAAADLICLAITGQGVFSLHIGVLRALPLYFVGVAIARVCEAADPPPSLLTTRILGLGAGAFLIALQVIGQFDFASVAAIAVIIYAAGVRPVARPSRLVEFGARLSLALFLTHALVATVWFGAVHHFLVRQDASTTTWWFIWALSFPVALAAAWAFDRYVDQPVQRWLANRHAPALAERKTTVSAS
jgi:peptidoglycan/LPS O-acetylase OafA/YrhL